MTTAETLVAAGWTQQPDGRWRSPLTQRAYDERTASLLAKLPGNVTTLRQLEQRKAHFRQHRTARQ